MSTMKTKTTSACHWSTNVNHGDGACGASGYFHHYPGHGRGPGLGLAHHDHGPDPWTFSFSSSSLEHRRPCPSPLRHPGHGRISWLSCERVLWMCWKRNGDDRGGWKMTARDLASRRRKAIATKKKCRLKSIQGQKT